jgi:hypothetical protein
MRARRLILVLAMAAMPAIALPGPAGAGPPTRGCPPPFLGPWTFQQIIDEFPPPPEIPIEVALAQLDRFDLNDDDKLCVMDVPTPAINVIDNVSNAP